MKPVESVTFTNDDGKDTFALVVSVDGDKLDLAWLDPDTYEWHAENQLPANSDRVK